MLAVVVSKRRGITKCKLVTRKVSKLTYSVLKGQSHPFNFLCLVSEPRKRERNCKKERLVGKGEGEGEGKGERWG